MSSCANEVDTGPPDPSSTTHDPSSRIPEVTRSLPLTSKEKTIQDTPPSHSHFVGERKKEKESSKILSSRTRHPSRTTRRRDASQDDTTQLVEGDNPEKIRKVRGDPPLEFFFRRRSPKKLRRVSCYHPKLRRTHVLNMYLPPKFPHM